MKKYLVLVISHLTFLHHFLNSDVHLMIATGTKGNNSAG